MTVTSERYHFADLRPYAIPDSLDELRGPAHGLITLPLSVYWGPRETPFHVDDDGDLIIAYSAIISNGTQDVQRSLVNENRLYRVWPLLSIDRFRVRPLWERRFPELCAHASR